MFNFGTPTDSAQLYTDIALGLPGPKISDKPLSEMSKIQLEDVITYRLRAYKLAAKDHQLRAVLDILEKSYAESFVALAAISPDFIKSFLRKKISVPGGLRNYARYEELLGLSR